MELVDEEENFIKDGYEFNKKSLKNSQKKINVSQKFASLSKREKTSKDILNDRSELKEALCGEK